MNPVPVRGADALRLTRRALLGGAVGAGLGLGGPGLQAQTAAPPEVAAALPGARLQGSGRLRFLGLRVYDSRLWVGEQSVRDAADGWVDVPLALELQYLRRLEGAQIAQRSLDEMRRQADITEVDGQRWLAAMKASFPDVRDGDRITGVHLPGRGVRFFYNGQPRGEVMEPAFARLFKGIWLSPATSEPALRAALLGR